MSGGREVKAEALLRRAKVRWVCWADVLAPPLLITDLNMEVLEVVRSGVHQRFSTARVRFLCCGTEERMQLQSLTGRIKRGSGLCVACARRRGGKQRAEVVRRQARERRVREAAQNASGQTAQWAFAVLNKAFHAARAVKC